MQNPIKVEGMLNRFQTLSALGCVILVLAACESEPVRSHSPAPPRTASPGSEAGPVGTALQANNLQPTEAVIGPPSSASGLPAKAPEGQFVTPPNLTGAWISENPEPGGNGRYWRREYVFMGNRWTATYTMAADKAMHKTLFVLKANGMFNLQNPSHRIEGAYLVAFRNIEKYLKLEKMEKQTQKELGFESCNLRPGVEENISSSGCGIAMRVTECPTDYDLIRQETMNGKTLLVLGNRFAEMSSCAEDKRPVALGLPLVKRTSSP